MPPQMMPSDKTSSVFLGLQVGLSGAGGLLGAWASSAVQQPCWHRFEQVGLMPPAPFHSCPGQFSNLKALLKSVTINNIPMERTNYGWVGC